MAETIAAALFDYAFAEGSFLAFDAAAAISASSAVINAVAIYTASTVYGNYQKRKALSAARDRLNASLEDRLVMTATAQAARSRVYGRVRNVDGVVFKGVHGTNSEFYTMVIALAGHEIDAVETVYANDVALTLDGSGYVQTAPYLTVPHDSGQKSGSINGSGAITLDVDPVPGTVTATWPSVGVDIIEGAYTVVSVVGRVVTLSGGPGTPLEARVNYQVAASDSKLRIRAYTGAASQDLYSVLQPLVGAQVQSTDRFAGIACLVVTMEYNSDAYPGGVPHFSAVLRGAKVNDPRTGTTAWSENPALIARDWALYANGGGCASGELNAAAFTAAANACDVSTTFTTTSGSETRALYQCGIAIPLDSNPDEALGEIVESMAGQWGWAGGLLTLRAGIYRAPVATITENWITDVSEITVIGAATADLVNVMRPSLANAANAYVVAQAAEVRAASYVTADGRELLREVALGSVTRAVHAQHICGVLMREAREGLTVTLPCNLRAYQLELFDVVAVTLPVFGWSAKEMEVIGWQFSITGGVQLTLRETAAGIYTPDASFNVATLSPNTHLPDPSVVPRLAGLAATSNTAALADASIISRMAVTWTAPASQSVLQSGSIEVQYHEANEDLPTGNWASAPPVPGSATTTTIAGLRASVQYLVRARAINSLGVRGDWSAQILHKVAGPRAPVVYLQASAPTDPQDGDIWIDNDAGNRQYLRDAGAWVDVRDQGIQAALDAAAAASAAADGKITCYYQPSTPASGDDGDLWFDSDDGNRQYVWTGGMWVVAADVRIGNALIAASDAQATADGKVTTFVSGSTPTAEGIGDLWLDSSDGNKLRRWQGGAWVLLPLGTGGIAANAVTTVLESSSGFMLAGAIAATYGVAPYHVGLWGVCGFTLSESATVIITINFTTEYSGSYSGTLNAINQMYIDGNSTPTKEVLYQQDAVGTYGFKLPVSMSAVVVLGAGQHIAGLLADSISAIGPPYFLNCSPSGDVTTKVEIIKR